MQGEKIKKGKNLESCFYVPFLLISIPAVINCSTFLFSLIYRCFKLIYFQSYSRQITLCVCVRCMSTFRGFIFCFSDCVELSAIFVAPRGYAGKRRFRKQFKCKNLALSLFFMEINIFITNLICS